MQKELQQEIEQLKVKLSELEQKVNQREKPMAEQYLKDLLPQLIGKLEDGYINWYLGDQWIFHQDLKNKIK